MCDHYAAAGPGPVLSRADPAAREAGLAGPCSRGTQRLKPTDALFQAGRIGDMELPHRIVMAPLTRSRAMQPGNVPYALNARYYAQRSACGAFIVSEATQISEQGQLLPVTAAGSPS